MVRLFGLIAFLALQVGTLVALIAAFYALVTRRPGRAVSVGRAWLWTIGLYVLVLLVVSFTSRTIVLPFPAEKRFCAIDCDLTIAVAGVMPAQRPVDGGRGLIVTVQVRSHAQTARIRPAALRAWLETDDGRRYAPLQPTPPALLESLDPGAARYAEFVFPDPPGGRSLRLVVLEGGWGSRFVIGDENSFFHRKVMLELPELLSPDLPRT